METVRQQLTFLYEKANVEIGEEWATIVAVQLLMPEVPDWLDGVNPAIVEELFAAYKKVAANL